MTKEEQEEFDRMKRKIVYYEAPLPLGKGNCYHKFSDEGLCIRCGEDAEEWEAGCVEEIIEDLQSISTREFADVLGRLIRRRYTAEHVGIAKIYLERIEAMFTKWGNYFAEPEEVDEHARINISQSHDFDLTDLFL